VSPPSWFDGRVAIATLLTMRASLPIELLSATAGAVGEDALMHAVALLAAADFCS